MAIANSDLTVPGSSVEVALLRIQGYATTLRGIIEEKNVDSIAPAHQAALDICDRIASLSDDAWSALFDDSNDEPSAVG